MGKRGTCGVGTSSSKPGKVANEGHLLLEMELEMDPRGQGGSPANANAS